MHSEWGRTIFDKTKLLEHLRLVGFKVFVPKIHNGWIFGTLEIKKQKKVQNDGLSEFWNQPKYTIKDIRGRNNVG